METCLCFIHTRIFLTIFMVNLRKLKFTNFIIHPIITHMSQNKSTQTQIKKKKMRQNLLEQQRQNMSKIILKKKKKNGCRASVIITSSDQQVVKLLVDKFEQENKEIKSMKGSSIMQNNSGINSNIYMNNLNINSSPQFNNRRNSLTNSLINYKSFQSVFIDKKKRQDSENENYLYVPKYWKPR
ncbi:hypothetical protein ABPG72_000134 [Tetrahymena utriculariae]